MGVKAPKLSAKTGKMPIWTSSIIILGISLKILKRVLWIHMSGQVLGIFTLIAWNLRFYFFPPNVALCVKSWFVVFALLSNVAAVELYYGIFAAVSLSQFLLPSHSCQVGASSQLQLVASLHFISPLLVSTTTLSDFKLSSTLYCSSLKV